MQARTHDTSNPLPTEISKSARPFRLLLQKESPNLRVNFHQESCRKSNVMRVTPSFISRTRAGNNTGWGYF